MTARLMLYLVQLLNSRLHVLKSGLRAGEKATIYTMYVDLAGPIAAALSTSVAKQRFPQKCGLDRQ